MVDHLLEKDGDVFLRRDGVSLLIERITCQHFMRLRANNIRG